MSEMTSFRSIIDIWPSHAAMASDIGATPAMVAKWAQRKNIPSDWWLPILRSERAQASGITAGMMAALAGEAPRRRTPAEARA